MKDLMYKMIINSFDNLEHYLNALPEQDLKDPGKLIQTSIFNKYHYSCFS